VSASIATLQFEVPDSGNIATAQDAMWCAWVAECGAQGAVVTARGSLRHPDEDQAGEHDPAAKPLARESRERDSI
jgi:hypothetical protein